MQKIRRVLSNKVTQNAGWLIGGSIANKLLAFFIGIWTARFLGPENYGLINYASAYTTFFFSLSSLGIQSVIVKHLIDRPDREGESMGTMLVLQGIASMLSIGVIWIIALMVDKSDPLAISVTVLCSLGLFFQMMDSIKYWFQAHLKSKYPVIATTVAYIVTSVYRIVLLITEKDVRWFALATSIDYLCVAILLLIIYKRLNGPRMRFSVIKAKEILGDSVHYIFAGLMVSIYAATDKLMLRHMMGEAAVGFYGTAVSVSNMWVFVLAAIIDSFNPVIMDLYNKDKQTFERKNRQLYAIVFYCSVAASTVIALIAPQLIGLLYGEAYRAAVQPLQIITWYVAFSYLGVARNTWLVCEKKQRYLTLLYSGAAVINIILNYCLIPIWGESGAAFASLLTQVSTVFIFPAFIKSLRPNVRLMVEAVLLRKMK